MRALLHLALALVLAASPALAQTTPQPPPDGASGGAAEAFLRGPVDPPAADAEPAPPAALPALLAPLAAAPSRPDAGRCRMACASSYYFCIANEASDNCPGDWGQCRAACGKDS